MHYAIADLGAVVVPGAALDTEVRQRGQTVYLPDGSVPLHPPVLSEDLASLLPDGPRAAVLWRLDLDGAGEPVWVDVRRAVVRSRARLDYAGVQAYVDAGRIHPAIAALPVVGPLRRALAVRRGAIELELPEQEVVFPSLHATNTWMTAGGWTVRVRRRTLVEDWNAEISLLTGTAAARIMLDAGSACCARCPRRSPRPSRSCGRSPGGSGSTGPRRRRRPSCCPSCPATPPPRWLCGGRRRRCCAAPATRRSTPPPVRAARRPGHAGIGATYAHVTAPLRRLVDRFGREVCLAVTAGADVPEWLRAALPTLPETMAASDAVAGAVTRACVDRTEAALLAAGSGRSSTWSSCGRRPTRPGRGVRARAARASAVHRDAAAGRRPESGWPRPTP